MSTVRRRSFLPTHNPTLYSTPLFPLPLTPYLSPANQPLPDDLPEAYDAPMHIQLSHPSRTVEIKGPKRAKDVLRELNLVVEAHLVIRGDELVTEDEMLADQDHIEIRPVISGGT